MLMLQLAARMVPAGAEERERHRLTALMSETSAGSWTRLMPSKPENGESA